MTAQPVHPHHAAFITMKAERLRQFIKARCGQLATYDAVSALSADNWARINELAGEPRPISAAVQAAVVGLFWAEQDRLRHPDPFAGLPL